MNFKTALLATVALCGLAAAPALAREAAPNIHLVAARGTTAGIHGKTKAIHPTVRNFTDSTTFNAAISTATAYKVKTEIVGQAWFAGSCTEPASKQKWVGLPKKTVYAKISAGTVTSALAGGACPGDVFRFYTVNYDLTSKKATGSTDSFTGTLTALNFEHTYNLYLKSTFNVAIGP